MVVPAVPLPGCPVHTSVLAARQGAATEAAAGALAAADEARAAVGSAMAAQARPTPATRRRLTCVFRFIAGFLSACWLQAHPPLSTPDAADGLERIWRTLDGDLDWGYI